jgi:hypothetical protein
MGLLLGSQSVQAACGPNSPPEPFSGSEIGNSYSFDYMSDANEEGQRRWFFERELNNRGAPIRLTWEDQYGAIFYNRKLPPSGRLYSCFNKEDRPWETKSWITYGDWGGEHRRDNLSFWRSVVETSEKKGEVPTSSQSSFYADFVDPKGETHSFGIQIVSEVLKKEASFSIEYSVTNEGKLPFILEGSYMQKELQGRGDVAIVSWSPLSPAVVPDVANSGLQKDPLRLHQSGAVAVAHQTQLLNVFLYGERMAAGLVSGYVAVGSTRQPR